MTLRSGVLGTIRCTLLEAGILFPDRSDISSLTDASGNVNSLETFVAEGRGDDLCSTGGTEEVSRELNLSVFSTVCGGIETLLLETMLGDTEAASDEVTDLVFGSFE